MNNKRFSLITLICVLVLLLAFAGANYVIDPLFQYHMPWLNMKPVVTNERYQNAGVAKHFEYDNVIMGNSMSENFLISDANDAFGGNTVKLTLAGFGVKEWTKELDIIKQKQKQPKYIMVNLDPFVFDSQSDRLNNEFPSYLYDKDIINDTNYLLNFSLTRSFTFKAIQSNFKNDIPDYNSVFAWGNDMPYGRNVVLNNYIRATKSKDTPNISRSNKKTEDIVDLFIPYIKSMEKTKFVFFYSPFSMLYWDGEMRRNLVDARESSYLLSCKKLIDYNNVNMYCWSDKQMLDIMSDLDNYKDTVHFSSEISRDILKRIKNKEGLLSKKSYHREIETLFQYIKSFDYESLF